MKRRTIKITVQGPLVSQSNDLPGFGIDAAMSCDVDGKPYLAGSHVWGKVREALTTFDAAYRECGAFSGFDLARWLGKTRNVESGVDEEEFDDLDGRATRRLIHISDCKGSSDEAAIRSRVAIDPATGAALDGALQTIETRWKPGKEVIFTGIVTVMLPDPEADMALRAVSLALNWTIQMGAFGSIGFGQVLSAELLDNVRDKSTSQTSPLASSLEVRLDFDGEPFLVSEGRVTPNSFASSEIIPGAAFKGALINLINANVGAPPGTFSHTGREKFPLIAEHIDSIRVRHFFPTINTERPNRIPFDLRQTGRSMAHSVAWDSDGSEIISFLPDWKMQQKKDASNCVGWPEIKRELRIRTEIDPRFRAARAERLFGLEMCQTHGVLWHGKIDLFDVSENKRPDLIKELSTVLQHGLPGFGRSKTFAHVELRDGDAEIQVNGRKNQFILELQSNALIRCPNQTYQDAFSTLSDDALICSEWFIREKLAGAAFLAERYFNRKRYRPYLLSEAGSVFVLEVRDGRENVAEKTVLSWLRKGLQISDSVQAFYDTDATWKTCPYIPENGYGEVRLREEAS